MRRNTFPPRPRPEDSRLRAPALERTPEPPKRKIFNCIVDDTALIDGAKKSTRDGIRKWVSQDAIRLYVPLHTLTLLNRRKTGNERVNIDAREALKWLDDITSAPASDGRVQLEGVDEAYATWDEVEGFLLPETLLSMEESESDDEYHEDLESSFNALDVSDKTSISSTHSLERSPKSPSSTKLAFRPTTSVVEGEELFGPAVPDLYPGSPARTANGIDRPHTEKSHRNGVPPHLQPLFSHILWRINKETNPGAALESFILLTNDAAKQMIAQKFGIRAKRLDQLRDAVAREEREYKNHLAMFKMEAEARNNKGNPTASPKPAERPKSSHSSASKPTIDSDDEDEVLLKRAPRGPANPTNNQRLFDPNDFGRTKQHPSPRGGRGGYVPRGRGGPPRGRGGFAPRGAYVPPGPTFRPPPAPIPAPRLDPNKPIDPDSFARSMPRGGGMRGNRRTLWEPN